MTSTDTPFRETYTYHCRQDDHPAYIVDGHGQHYDAAGWEPYGLIREIVARTTGADYTRLTFLSQTGDSVTYGVLMTDHLDGCTARCDGYRPTGYPCRCACHHRPTA
jgi:hypothetical protein